MLYQSTRLISAKIFNLEQSLSELNSLAYYNSKFHQFDDYDDNKIQINCNKTNQATIGQDIHLSDLQHSGLQDDSSIHSWQCITEK